ESEPEERIVVLDHVRERRGAAVVEVGRVLPQSAQRRRAILLLCGARGVRPVHTGLRRSVQDAGVDVREPRFGAVADGAAAVAVEDLLAAAGRGGVDGAGGWRRRLEAQLILGQRWQL